MKPINSLLVQSVIAAFGILVGNTSHAAVIFNNGLPDLQNGFDISSLIAAEDFTLGVQTTITDIRFWSLEGTGFFSGYTGSITWQIYSNAGNTPGVLLASGTTSAVTQALTGRELITYTALYESQNDFSVGSVLLDPGTYWLGLHNGPLSTIPTSGGDEFYWETTSPNSTFGSRYDSAPFGDNVWDETVGIQRAFQISGITSVPEPSTLALFSLGGLAFIRYKGMNLAGRSRKSDQTQPA